MRSDNDADSWSSSSNQLERTHVLCYVVCRFYVYAIEYMEIMLGTEEAW